MSDPVLPSRFARWFAARGWQARPHQLEMIDAARKGEDALLLAPTGGGKTLGGFLPSLIDLADVVADGPKRPHRLHTLYISPLKALSVDVARNLMTPVAEMDLDIRIETRTGDTPVSKRQRQRDKPPDILLTTPEQLALFCASPNARAFFGDLERIIIDEIHALAPQKRGDLLSLGLATLAQWAPGASRAGLSATVSDEGGLARWLTPQGETPAFARIVRGREGPKPQIDILSSTERIPWSGHSARHAMGEVYAAIKQARLTLVFVNTRAQAEATFQALWRLNENGLAIALHHGSLAVEQRRKVEAAMASGQLKAVVCTSTLDLGIDWGDVDLVIQMGAPKGSARLIQRLGRSNHRLDEPSRALLAPANRFEHLECEAARAAVAEGVLDGEPLRAGALDVLAQHMTGRACGEAISSDDLFAEVTQAAPYAGLTRREFDRVLEFCSTGGYALDSYERFRRLIRNRDGLWQARNARVAQRHRMNVGTIIEAEMLTVRLKGRGARGGKALGEVEEWFLEQLVPGDTFVFAGQILEFQGISENAALVTRSSASEPKVPSYNGGKFPLSTYLARRVREIAHDPAQWSVLPDQVRDWLTLQQEKSRLPQPDDLLVETFPKGGKHYLVCYPFEGRLAHQSLGMLLTRRLERLRMRPTGFVANEYALAVWGLRDLSGVDMDALFSEDMLGDDLDAWLAESPLMKRTFRQCAVISGLIERRLPGHEKTSRQVTFSADLIYDVLREHDPEHILLQAAWRDAATGLLDIRRLGEALKRVKGNIHSINLPRVSPLAVPVLLEIGREPVYGEAHESLLADAADDLVKEAMTDD
ncbi:ligase-associated DNA damage response DEXH box helicase [Hyphobacterium indicum]|uniref:ligase-associated DNA damage response DEXH box helicase n=1 Tax=Hyphobacterium indicum TaxID=2162714 RepID=UPI000D653355|nr:ligase-associated DNA damage response DEXH box helicase [Hyphobacterium indicum]